MKTLAKILSTCDQVTRYDSEREKEAWTLAHAFNDIEESFTKIFGEQLPPLISGTKSSTEINDALLDIGEELRHVLYHIGDPKFYRYLQRDEAGAVTATPE